ncbi:MAG: hypothetical protein PHG54_02935 [Smithellaceae bacterium]|nr:hypothetical protein [Syntrophaceae bacterium]MDD4240361.1 hypothetical protein [Smithellaceae bacterium]NLX52134.1 hypothetical protein [Deltaproteobacteria bacterium]
MPDYWIKISEREEEDIRRHHYLITAADEAEAKKSAMQFMARFIDDDENPERIDDGFMFYNKAVVVKLESIKPTTKDKFKDFLLNLHTINMT